MDKDCRKHTSYSINCFLSCSRKMNTQDLLGDDYPNSDKTIFPEPFSSGYKIETDNSALF